MEEDIKILEEIIERLKDNIILTTELFDKEDVKEIEREIKAINNVLKRYKELEENNKELKKYYASRKEVEDLKETIACLHESGKDYIPISVIQNKLIEAEHYINNVDVTEGQAMYKVLQELLEERNK